MATSTVSNATTYTLSSCVDFFKQHPTITTVSAVAFAALGIAAGVATYFFVATVPLAVILGLSAALCLTVSAGLTYLATQSSNVGQQIADRVKIMQETLSDLKAGSYTSANGTKHTLNLNAAATGAKLLLSAGNHPGQRPGTATGSIAVKDKDCLYEASAMRAKGLNPIVLDMASDGHFGGGYLTGARAQEEECCRRSGLSLAVDTQHGLQTRNFYPLSFQSPSAGLYVPSVPVFRAAHDKNYQYLDQPFDVAFGVIAAFNAPPLDNSSGKLRLFPNEANITREKIRTFFEMARQNGHDSVIFGALGCGAFRNPPEHIAEIALDVISKEFKHCFKEVVFAVLDDHNAGHAHNPQGNFTPFARQAITSGGKVFDANDQEIVTI